MSDSKEIKIREEDFNSALQKLDKEISDLCDAYKTLSSKNGNLANSWEGKGGDAFLKAGYTIERNFSKRISDLKSRRKDIDETCKKLKDQDELCSKTISDFASEVASAIATTAAEQADSLVNNK